MVGLKVVRVRHSEYIAMWKEAMVRLEQVGIPQERRRVGESRLRSVTLKSEGFDDEGTPRLRPVTCCSRVPGGAIGVEVSHDDVVTMEVEEKVNIWPEIGRIVADRGI